MTSPFLRLLFFMSLITTYPINTKIQQQAPPEESINNYFQQIKSDPEALRDFLWKMPKGGDIHHHLIGSVFAEDFLDKALENNLWIDPDTYQLYFDKEDALVKKASRAISIRALVEETSAEKDHIIDHWSVRNHLEHGRDGRHWFFASFQKFQPAIVGHEAYFLTKLCKAAAAENLQYLETMVEIPSIIDRVAQLSEKIERQEGDITQHQLEAWYGQLESEGIDQWAEYNAETMDHWVEHTERHGVTLRFQTVGFRIFPDQRAVFAHLVLAFKSAQLSDNLVGVNLVAPEDHTVSLKNYKNHMHMLHFLQQRFPKTNLALHAGELQEGKGDVQAGDLEDHIAQAISIAGAKRIGHGVDITGEVSFERTLIQMKEEGIAVEVNLESNRVILETHKANHPLGLYLKAGVPVCISSDDAGILRTDLTHQYEMLVEYVPELSYVALKDIVFNGLKYSFLTEPEKATILDKLRNQFEVFETRYKSQNSDK